MNDSKVLTCPNCGHDLACSYYRSGRVVGCYSCGLRGPKSDSLADSVAAPLTLFTQHCTHAAEVAAVEAENERLRAFQSDIENATRGACDERCDCNERHCSCVPLLRSALQRARELLRESVQECRIIRQEGVEYYPSNLEQRWFVEAAQQAAGGE